MVKGDSRSTAVQEAQTSTSADGTRGGTATDSISKDEMKLMATWGVCIERGDLLSRYRI